MALRVTRETGTVFTDPQATVAWSGALQTDFKTALTLGSFFGRGSREGDGARLCGGRSRAQPDGGGLRLDRLAVGVLEPDALFPNRRPNVLSPDRRTRRDRRHYTLNGVPEPSPTIATSLIRWTLASTCPAWVNVRESVFVLMDDEFEAVSAMALPTVPAVA